MARRTDGFEGLSQSLEASTPEYVERTTGVPFEEVRRAARVFAAASSASIVYGNGVTRSEQGTDGVKALANLALLTGNIERKGTGLHAMQAENNAQGACDMGALPDFLPGYCHLSDLEGRQRFEERWGVQVPAESGLTAVEMMAEAADGSIKGMYIVGENPVLSYPDPAAAQKRADLTRFPPGAGHLPYRDGQSGDCGPSRLQLRGEGGHLHELRGEGAGRPEGPRAPRREPPRLGDHPGAGQGDGLSSPLRFIAGHRPTRSRNSSPSTKRVSEEPEGGRGRAGGRDDAPWSRTSPVRPDVPQRLRPVLTGRLHPQGGVPRTTTP